MGKVNRLYALLGVVGVMVIAASAVTYTARVTSAGGSGGADCVTSSNGAADPGATDGETSDGECAS